MIFSPFDVETNVYLAENCITCIYTVSFRVASSVLSFRS